MDELSKLAERCEQAEWSEQGTLLLDAWDVIAPLNGLDWASSHAGTFCAMIEVGAFESAALMLLPEGMAANIEIRASHRSSRSGAYARITLIEENGFASGDEGHGAVISLAILTAGLRSRSLVAFPASDGEGASHE